MIGFHYNSTFFLHFQFREKKKNKKKKTKAFNVRVLLAVVEDLWSSSHFITSEQIVNWLQGITVSSGLTQTVNPQLWLAVMKPCKVSAAASAEVSLNQRHHTPKNAQRQIQTVSRPPWETTSTRVNCNELIETSENAQVSQRQCPFLAACARQCKTAVLIILYGWVND